MSHRLTLSSDQEALLSAAYTYGEDSQPGIELGAQLVRELIAQRDHRILQGRIKLETMTMEQREAARNLANFLVTERPKAENE